MEKEGVRSVVSIRNAPGGSPAHSWINLFAGPSVIAIMDSTLNKPAQGEPAEYGLEVLCASWNPLVAAIAEPVDAARELIAELTAGDVEAFLARFYRCQRG